MPALQHTKKIVREVLFPPCLIETTYLPPCLIGTGYSINTNKDDLSKENARMKQVFKKNGCPESIISTIFKRITYNHSLSRSENKSHRCQRKGENWHKFT